MILRKDRVLVGTVLFAVVLLVELIVLGFAGASLSKEARELKSNEQKLDRLSRRSCFPSLENIAIEKQNLAELEDKVRELAGEMSADPFPLDAVEAAEFSARAQDVIERFQARAERSGVKLTTVREAGFEKYTRGGVVPQAAQVSRLTRQLYSMERVAEVLVASGVSSIEQLARDVFEDAEAYTTERRRLRVPTVSKDRKNVRPGSTELYTVERVYVSFLAPEEVVWRVMEGMAAAPHFMAVVEFAHESNTKILSYDPEAVKRGGDDNETLAYLAGGILTGEKALARPERIIAGHEPVKVRLVVEVYNFNPEEAP